MSSPDRMEMLARAIRNIRAAMDEMDRQQQANDARMQQHEERVLEWEQQIEQSRQAHEGWLLAHNERIEELRERSRRHGERVSEILGVIAEIQADIARLDAAS